MLWTPLIGVLVIYWSKNRYLQTAESLQARPSPKENEEKQDEHYAEFVEEFKEEQNDDAALVVVNKTNKNIAE